jgi:hypothetical protein
MKALQRVYALPRAKGKRLLAPFLGDRFGPHSGVYRLTFQCDSTLFVRSNPDQDT